LKVPWTPFNLGVFLVVFGGLMFASLARISNYDPIQSFTLTIMIFGVWLALAAFILTPPDKYAPHRTLVFGWGAMLAALGVLLFVGVTGSRFTNSLHYSDHHRRHWCTRLQSDSGWRE